MATEIINTAIENLVDLVSPEKNKQAGLVKDVAAGGVLLSALTAVIVAYFMFFDIDKIKEILQNFSEKPQNIMFFILSAILWIFIIFYKKKDTKRNEKNEN